MKFTGRSRQPASSGELHLIIRITTRSILHYDYCGWNHCSSITSGGVLFLTPLLKYPYSLPTFNYEWVWFNYKDLYIKKLCL